MRRNNTEIRWINSFPELIEFYNEKYAPILERELELSKKTIHSEQSDHDKARKILIGSSHQRRLLGQHIERENAIEALIKNKLWEKSFNDFEELYDKVAEIIGELHRIGPLAVYDVSKRIGASLGIMPLNYVYVPRDACKGAKKLIEGRINHRVETEKFDKWFKNLSAVHIENFLCLMKDYMADGELAKPGEIEFQIWPIEKVEDYFK